MAGSTLRSADCCDPMIAVRPRVTIGLPIYNAEKTLAKAIVSVLDQTFSDWELLLMDDGSTDSSCAVARQFTDSRICLVSDGVNKGISFRLNQAVAMARGRYFCRMDADDVCFPERLQKQFDFMESHQDIDLTAASVVTFDGESCLKGIVQVARNHGEICRRPWNGFHFPHPTWFGKIEWFRHHAYSSSADGAEDQLLLYNAYQNSVFAGLPDVLLGYYDDRRSFKKMFGRRKRFWREIGAAAIKKYQFHDFFWLCIFQSAKIIADLLYIKSGFSVMRNALQPVDTSVARIWNKLGSNQAEKIL